MDILVQYFKAVLISKLPTKLDNSNTIQQSKYASNKEFSSRIKKGWEIFNKYYSKTDNSPFYTAALILHPNRCIKYIKANWKPKWVKPILKKVKGLQESYQKKAPSPLISLLYKKKQPQEQELNIFNQIA